MCFLCVFVLYECITSKCIFARIAMSVISVMCIVALCIPWNGFKCIYMFMSRIILRVTAHLMCVCVCWQLASGIYSFACSLWSHHTDCFLQQICARDETAALSSLERTLLSLKGSKTHTHRRTRNCTHPDICVHAHSHYVNLSVLNISPPIHCVDKHSHVHTGRWFLLCSSAMI